MGDAGALNAFPRACRLRDTMTAAKNQFITIVAGLPRSGTSMMMRMIEAGGIPALADNVRRADEDNPLGYYEFEAVKRTRKDATWLEGAPGKVVKTVHVLLYDLPLDRDYRVVFMRRKLEEVVASQDLMLQRQDKPPSDLTAEQLIRAFRIQLLKLDKWLEDQPGFQVLRVNYNEAIQDPVSSVQAVNEFLGGHLDTQAMLKVVDPSLYRQRR